MEINQWGNKIVRSFDGQGDRYKFDFEVCKLGNGWAQFDTDQDAWYFGVWVHPGKRMFVTYCEGDVTVVYCSTEITYHAELEYMAKFYGSPPPAFTVIGDGKVTEYYDERPS